MKKCKTIEDMFEQFADWMFQIPLDFQYLEGKSPESGNPEMTVFLNNLTVRMIQALPHSLEDMLASLSDDQREAFAFRLREVKKRSLERWEQEKYSYTDDISVMTAILLGSMLGF